MKSFGHTKLQGGSTVIAGPPDAAALISAVEMPMVKQEADAHTPVDEGNRTHDSHHTKLHPITLFLVCGCCCAWLPIKLSSLTRHQRKG